MKWRRRTAASTGRFWKYVEGLTIPSSTFPLATCLRFSEPILHSISPQVSSEYGTYTTVKARFWQWLSGDRPRNLLSCSPFARKRTVARPMGPRVVLGEIDLAGYGPVSSIHVLKPQTYRRLCYSTKGLRAIKRRRRP